MENDLIILFRSGKRLVFASDEVENYGLTHHGYMVKTKDGSTQLFSVGSVQCICQRKYLDGGEDE